MNNSQGTFINTDPEADYVEPVDINVTITMETPQEISAVGLPPYNPFLIVNKIRGREIHLPGKPFSEKADTAVFKTEDDWTDPLDDIYYKTKDNFPWAICVPYQISQMKEHNDFITGYLVFSSWAQSSGNNNKNWYITENPENINSNYIYSR
jgi:LruC domain-containing protein